MSNSNLKSPSLLFGRDVRALSRHTWQERFVLLFIGAIFYFSGTPLAHAQFYTGALGGVATLAGDANSTLASSGSNFSSYNARNGFALELIAGRHISDYFSVQANYIWNRNPLILASGVFNGGTQEGYKELRSSSQQSAIGDVLIYFRKRDSRLRPYLSLGTGFVHFSTQHEHLSQVVGSPFLPPQSFHADQIALHVPVGIDARLRGGWAFRYTFSETISKNPIRDHLSPPPRNSLKNFQSLFGIVKQF